MTMPVGIMEACRHRAARLGATRQAQTGSAISKQGRRGRFVGGWQPGSNTSTGVKTSRSIAC